MTQLLLYLSFLSSASATEKNRELFQVCMDASAAMSVEEKRNAQQARCIKEFRKVISFEDCIAATKKMSVEERRNAEQEKCISYYKHFINFEQCFEA